MSILDSRYIRCPHCGERFEALIDASGGDTDYIEDCPVCCKPIMMHCRTDENGEFDGLDAEQDF